MCAMVVGTWKDEGIARDSAKLPGEHSNMYVYSVNYQTSARASHVWCALNISPINLRFYCK